MTFNQILLADLKTKNYNQVIITDKDMCKYNEVVKKIDYACELVGKSGQQVKPYFDVDKYVNQDEDYDIDVDILEYKIILQDLFKLNDVDDIYTISRDPRVDKDKIKYSYHFTIDKIRISNYNIKKLLEDNNITCFDTSVYDENRGMACIGNTKKPNSNEILPAFKPYENIDDISKFCITYIKENFEDYDLKFPKIEPKKTKVVKNDVNDLLQVDKCEDYELIKNLVDCLNVERADDYSNWLNVGFCLYNIDSSLLELWDNFSKKSDKYEMGKCQELWDKMTKKNMTLASLKWWAKKDNQKMYNQVMINSVSTVVDLAIGSDGAHYDIACVVAHYMKDKMVYDSKVKSWYIVNEKTNIWELDKEGNKIPTILAVDICKLFLKRCSHYSSIKCEDDIQKAVNDEKSKKCLKIATQLKNASFQDSIKKMLKSVCLRDDFFETYLNKNIHLFAFNNCLYDTNTNKFRDIEPTDYISITTGYDYDPLNPNMEYIKEVEKLLWDMMPNENKYNYLMDICSLRLYGKNLYQEFYIFTGGGANGKSVLLNLKSYAFGNYFGKLNPETFTKESKGANQTSEISGVSNCRAVCIEEPNEQEKLIVNRLKELSGDAPYKTRGLYQEAFSFIPQFALLFLCNDIPALSKVEYAIQRRLRVLKFDIKFTDKPMLSNEKKKDNTLNKKMNENSQEYGRAFMYLLLKNWESKKLLEKLNTPDEVLESSAEYMNESNEVKTFLNDYYEKVADDKAKISSQILYNHFKVIYRETKMRKDIFKKLVEDEGFRWKRENKGCFHYNLKKKEYNDESEDDDE